MNGDENSPLVSVVTPFFNAAPFLQATIDSVLAQSHGNFEMLMIDDGSTDDSRRIAQANADRDRRLRLLHHAGNVNRGKAASRNLGLEKAGGAYVVFLDADDLLLPEKLARQVRLLRDNPGAGAVLGRTLYWFEDAGADDYLGPVGWDAGSMFEPPELMVLLLRRRGLVPCLCSPMIRLDLVRRLGGFDLAIPHLFEDQVLLAKVFLAGATLTDDYCGEKYRQHAGSSSAQAAASGVYDHWRLSEAEKRYVDWLAGYVERMGYDQPELRRAVVRMQRRFRHPWFFGGVRRAAYEAHRLRRKLKTYWKGKSGDRENDA